MVSRPDQARGPLAEASRCWRWKRARRRPVVLSSVATKQAVLLQRSSGGSRRRSAEPGGEVGAARTVAGCAQLECSRRPDSAEREVGKGVAGGQGRAAGWMGVAGVQVAHHRASALERRLGDPHPVGGCRAFRDRLPTLGAGLAAGRRPPRLETGGWSGYPSSGAVLARSELRSPVGDRGSARRSLTVGRLWPTLVVASATSAPAGTPVPPPSSRNGVASAQVAWSPGRSRAAPRRPAVPRRALRPARFPSRGR
jgi:hypothetical protein